MIAAWKGAARGLDPARAGLPRMIAPWDGGRRRRRGAWRLEASRRHAPKPWAPPLPPARPPAECSARAPRLPRTRGFPRLGPVLLASSARRRLARPADLGDLLPVHATLHSRRADLREPPSPIAASGGMSLAAAPFGKRVPATGRVARGVTRCGQTWLAGHVHWRLREGRHVRRRPCDRASSPRASRGRSPAPPRRMPARRYSRYGFRRRRPRSSRPRLADRPRAMPGAREHARPSAHPARPRRLGAGRIAYLRRA